MMNLLAAGYTENISTLVDLGLNHEEQHQELILTDLLNLFAQNPLKPAYQDSLPAAEAQSETVPLSWRSFAGGIFDCGHDGTGFGFDCEKPRHQVLLQDFKLADRAVTNAEWIQFMEDGGYETPTLWFADGWDFVCREKWTAPLYWQFDQGQWVIMTLRGSKPLDLNAPVSHISYFEADAYSRWASARLPTEPEWEFAVADMAIEGNFAGSGYYCPLPQSGPGLKGMYGDVWEWTQSAFGSYPGFEISEGAVGEYNGKFMSGQMVLKGGSCLTPEGHIRASYRNFFHPQKRWQFSGLWLARDC